MDLGFTSEELAFRDELRAFIRDQLPDDIRERPGRRRNTRTYLRSRRECGIGSFLSGPAPLIEKIKFASDSSVPLLRKAHLGVANRRRRHEGRTHLQVQARDSNACLE
jgi:hypothetical protein